VVSYEELERDERVAQCRQPGRIGAACRCQPLRVEGFGRDEVEDPEMHGRDRDEVGAEAVYDPPDGTWIGDAFGDVGHGRRRILPMTSPFSILRCASATCSNANSESMTASKPAVQ